MPFPSLFLELFKMSRCFIQGRILLSVMLNFENCPIFSLFSQAELESLDMFVCLSLLSSKMRFH